MPADLDMLVWALCMNSDGDIIRNPNEILHHWSYEQVLDALEVKELRNQAVRRIRDAEKRKAQTRRR